mmetsp:Transcript_24838/g.41507  ORF Transcript_24838/g.41507 Transcript_24838/m.41507 type:complete len:133 (+) Transcript_24838:53-451(+)
MMVVACGMRNTRRWNRKYLGSLQRWAVCCCCMEGTRQARAQCSSEIDKCSSLNSGNTPMRLSGHGAALCPKPDHYRLQQTSRMRSSGSSLYAAICSSIDIHLKTNFALVNKLQNYQVKSLYHSFLFLSFLIS